MTDEDTIRYIMIRFDTTTGSIQSLVCLKEPEIKKGIPDFKTGLSLLVPLESPYAVGAVNAVNAYLRQEKQAKESKGLNVVA